MNEVYELKRALLLERRERGMLLAQLAELQLKVLEDEHAAKQKEEEPE